MEITTRVTWENERRSWGGKKEWEGKQLLPSLFPVQSVLLLINTRARTHTHVYWFCGGGALPSDNKGAHSHSHSRVGSSLQPGRVALLTTPHSPRPAVPTLLFLGTGSILEVTVTEALIPRLGKPGRFTTAASLSKRWICRAESDNKGCLLSGAWTARSQFGLCHSQWEQRFLRSGEYS